MLLPWNEGGTRGQHVKRKTKRLNSGNILVHIFMPLRIWLHINELVHMHEDEVWYIVKYEELGRGNTYCIIEKVFFFFFFCPSYIIYLGPCKSV